MSLWLGILNVINRKIDILDGKIDIIDTEIGEISDLLLDHFHSFGTTYPELSDPILLTKAIGVWAAYPTPIEIIPEGVVGTTFGIHWINVSSISANGNYTLDLYSGSVGFEVQITNMPFARTAIQSQEGNLRIQTPLLPAGTRISAAISSSNNAANNALFKVVYHAH